MTRAMGASKGSMARMVRSATVGTSSKRPGCSSRQLSKNFRDFFKPGCVCVCVKERGELKWAQLELHANGGSLLQRF